MSRADWWQAPTLEGPTLRLSGLRLADASDFFTALGSPVQAAEVLAHLRYPPLPDVAAVRPVVAAAVTDRDRVPYAQRLKTRALEGTREPEEAGELVGTTSFYDIDPGTRSLAIGHTWIARPHWRTGVNTESKLLMMGRAFDGLGAERVVWHTDIRNERSQAAIARLGAQREGVLRHHRIRSDGSWRDTVQFAMLADEWPAARDRLEAALRRD